MSFPVGGVVPPDRVAVSWVEAPRVIDEADVVLVNVADGLPGFRRRRPLRALEGGRGPGDGGDRGDVPGCAVGKSRTAGPTAEDRVGDKMFPLASTARSSTAPNPVLDPEMSWSGATLPLAPGAKTLRLRYCRTR